MGELGGTEKPPILFILLWMGDQKKYIRFFSFNPLPQDSKNGHLFQWKILKIEIPQPSSLFSLLNISLNSFSQFSLLILVKLSYQLSAVPWRVDWLVSSAEISFFIFLSLWGAFEKKYFHYYSNLNHWEELFQSWLKLRSLNRRRVRSQILCFFGWFCLVLSRQSVFTFF